MIVLIDDERSFKKEFQKENTIILRNVVDALEWLESLSPEDEIDQLWFDHDLGIVDGEKITSIPISRKLEELCFFDKAPIVHEVVVHTTNNVGGDEIVAGLSRHFKTLRVFAGDYLEVVEDFRSA